MEPYRETAYCLTLWYALLTALVAVLAIVLQDLDRPSALLIAANVALLFALVLMAVAGRLTDSNIARGQFWRTLSPRERSRGEAGTRIARNALHETWLKFAKGAAALAIVLSSVAFVGNGADQRVRAAALAQAPVETNLAPAYRDVRLLPMN